MSWRAPQKETHERYGILIRTLVTLTFDLQRTWVVFGDVFIEPEGRKGRDLWFWMGSVRKMSVKCVLQRLEIAVNIQSFQENHFWVTCFASRKSKQKPSLQAPEKPESEILLTAPCQLIHIQNSPRKILSIPSTQLPFAPHIPATYDFIHDFLVWKSGLLPSSEESITFATLKSFNYLCAATFVKYSICLFLLPNQCCCHHHLRNFSKVS